MRKQYIISLDNIISYVAFITQLLPVILYLFFKNKIGDEVLRVISLIMFIGFCVDAMNIYFSTRNRASFSTVNSFILVETLALLYFFYEIISKKIIKTFITLFSLLFIGYWIFAFIEYGTKRLLETGNAIEAIAIIGLSIYYFYEQLTQLEIAPIYTRSRFWVVAGYLLYTSGTFFLFLYLDSLNTKDQGRYYILNSIFLIIKIVFLSIAMCMNNKVPGRQKFQLT